MCCGVGCRHGSDLALLWLWCRPALVALIRPLAWEPPCAADAALKGKKKSDHFDFFYASTELIFSQCANFQKANYLYECMALVINSIFACTSIMTNMVAQMAK